MKGDFTRSTFKPEKHYNGVRLQQGRVLLDADFNEHIDIEERLRETEAIDVIGPCGAPQDNDGFQIEVTPDGSNLTISPGRIYVDGILCEREELSVTIVEFSGSDQVRVAALELDDHRFESGQWTEVLSEGAEAQMARISEVDSAEKTITFEEEITAPDGEVESRLRLVATYSTQSDYPSPDPALDSEDLEPGTYLAFVDVWDYHVTALEDPAIREVALGGPDTTTRTKIVCQVKLLLAGELGDNSLNCLSDLEDWNEQTAPSTGQMSARAEPEETQADPCIIPASAGFRGLENQLYRVEIHRVNSESEITVKWSRENGSVVVSWEDQDSLNPNNLTVSSTGKDEVLRFAPDNWIELTDDGRELRGEPGILVKVTNVDGKVLTIDPGLETVDINDFPLNPKARRWDMPGDMGETTVDLSVSDNWIKLEDGIEVMFESGTYRTGDYWMVPARTATGDIEWPRDDLTSEPLTQSPHGIYHHYCRLALLSFDKENWAVLEDCRPLFPALTQLERFFYVGGDGQEAMPGNELCNPLEVGLFNGRDPVEGRTVVFAVEPGNGMLIDASDSANTGVSIEVATDANGIAACQWQLNGEEANVCQRATAALLDAASQVVLHPIHFNANLSIASQVYYNSSDCLNPDKPNNVQDALDQLCQNFTLYYLSGDGQEADPGQQVPNPLAVRVANGQWPAEAKVTFRVVKGSGQVDDGVAPDIEVTVASDPETGLASCNWTLDSTTPDQRVLAFLSELGEQGPTVGFNATLRTASSIFFDPSNCKDFGDDVTDVQAAIDALCEMGVGAELGIQVKDVLQLGQSVPILNDDELPVNALIQGIRIVCDEALADESVNRKPICFVTLDLPYPFNLSDQQLWNFPGVLGFQPLKLAADVNADGESIVWKPIDNTSGWLSSSLFPMMEEMGLGNRVLAHLTVKGNFIWSREDPNRFLDGDSFGQPAQGRTDLILPTGNGLRGGDLEMWFWLVERAREPALVANDDTAITFSGVPIAIDVLGNDTGSSPLSIASVSALAAGGNVIVTGETITYTPPPGFLGTDTFTYTVQDGAGNTDIATVSIIVIAIIDFPTSPGDVVIDLPTVEFPDTLIATGSTTTVSGTGFQPRESVFLVAISDEGVALQIGNVIADENGGFQADVEISNRLPTGDFTVRAIGQGGSQTPPDKIVRIRNPL